MRKLFILILTACTSLALQAQDEMYFGSARKSKQTTVAPQQIVSSGVVDANAPSRYRIPAEGTVASQDAETDTEETYYSGSTRSVDEYNRRDRFSRQYAEHLNDSLRQDSILVSREDYEMSRRMKRFDGYNNVTLVVNANPWLYDPWYYDPWYYRPAHFWSWHYGWYDPWYDPWYYGPSWYLGYSWGGFGIHWGGYYRPWYGPHHYVSTYVNRREVYTNGRWATARHAAGITSGHRTTTTTDRYARSSTERRTYSAPQRSYSATQPRSNVFGNSYSNAAAARSTTPTRSSSFGGGMSHGGVSHGGGARPSGMSGAHGGRR